MNYKKVHLKYTIPFLLAGGLLVGCGGSGGNAPENIVDVTPDPLPANITIDNAKLRSAIASVSDVAPDNPDIIIQGVIDANGLSISVPYTVTNTAVTLPAYSRSVTLDASVTEDDESGIVATFAWEEQTSLPVGSGAFTATITIDDSKGNADGIYKAKQLEIYNIEAGALLAAVFPYATDSIGNIGEITMEVYPGILDRMFGKADNTGDTTTHRFVYLPVINHVTGRTWLNNNLGANYANMESPVFNSAKQAYAPVHFDAYGSLFQWGRRADGHELIIWLDSKTGIGKNGRSSTRSDNPTHASFIIGTNDPDALQRFWYDWRVNSHDKLWASETSPENVCPVGYRLPQGYFMIGEWFEEINSWQKGAPLNDIWDAANSSLALPAAGMRINKSNNSDLDDGEIIWEGRVAMYWTYGGKYFNAQRAALLMEIRSNGCDRCTGTDWVYRGRGHSVRCIKDQPSQRQ